MVVCSLLLSGCDDFSLYGRLGGADETARYQTGDLVSDAKMGALLESLSGVWYSHYAGMGRLDGYRIGRWEDFEKLVIKTGKNKLFPKLEPEILDLKTYTGYKPTSNDYFVFYDDTVYGQSDDGVGGNGGWEGLVTRYIGIVQGINLFYGDPDRGAIIIEYLEGAYPTWLDRWSASKNGKKPFFGIYYRVLNPDQVQMANAVNLEALYAGKEYYTEKASLEDAIKYNTVDYEAEYISWGVVIPQDREKEKP
jgi:hypothetical protein